MSMKKSIAIKNSIINNLKDKNYLSNFNLASNNLSNFRNKFSNYIGIDVSKDKLDIYCSINNSYYIIKNNTKDIETFIKNTLDSLMNSNDNLQNIKPCDKSSNKPCDKSSNKPSDNLDINTNIITKDNTLIVIDLTGGYEILCRDIFYNLGYNKIHLAQGLKVKYFIRSFKDNKAKTDKIDSYMLAKYGEVIINPWIIDLNKANKNIADSFILYIPLSKHRVLLNEYVQRVIDLKDIKQKEKNRLQSPNNSSIVTKSIKSFIKTLEKQINQLELEITSIINQDLELKKIYNFLIGYNGIGNIVAYTLLSQLPELGIVNRRTIANISGVAPTTKQSGTSVNGYGRTKGGRPAVKRALFIAILSLIRHNDTNTFERYEYFRFIGKKKMVAIVALMRKFIITLNAKLKEELNKTDSSELNKTDSSELNKTDSSELNKTDSKKIIKQTKQSKQSIITKRNIETKEVKKFKEFKDFNLKKELVTNSNTLLAPSKEKPKKEKILLKKDIKTDLKNNNKNNKIEKL